MTTAVATEPRLEGVDILVVDDHRVFGEVLAMRLEAEARVRTVAVAGSLADARSRLPTLGGGLILLDYHLGEENGLDLLDDVARSDPRPTVVVVSMSRDPDKIVRALQAGADAWLLKAEGYRALVEVAVDARNEVMTIPSRSLREVVQRLLSKAADERRPESFLDSLSSRQLDILRLLAAAVPRDQIAKRLYISPNTVRTHVQHLHKRAGVHSTVALVARAREAGLEA
ncbi:MAG: response regulator transcription factor [Nocardioides sp.]|nr:response regulator transcription factor [Nocardioides sp.]